MAQAEQVLDEVLDRGRAGAGRNGVRDSDTVRYKAEQPSADELRLAEVLGRYEQLGDEPPEFHIVDNDAAYENFGAHTNDRHGPDIALRRAAGSKTVEGRVYGDVPWRKAINASFKWTDPSTMHREINGYIRENWETIRSDLAFENFHESVFNAGHRIGLGYYNRGMYGAGPRAAEYGETSVVKIRIGVVPNSDPAKPFIITAFPSGLG